MRSLIFVLGLVLLVACGSPGASAEPTPTPAPVSVIANQGAYAVLVDEVFSMNLLLEFSRLDAFERDAVEAVALTPASPLIEVVNAQTFSQAIGGLRSRRNLTLDVRALAPGEHTFTGMLIRTSTRSYEVPVGELRVEILTGQTPGFFTVFQTRGVFEEPQPLVTTLVNPTRTTYQFRGIIPTNPALSYGPEDLKQIAADGTATPVPPEGLTLEPGARIEIRLDWTVDMPNDEGRSVELRPLALLEGPDGPVYIPMANLVFRNAQAVRRL
ncbi:hypothetical protein [Candidatus Chloroploca sp. Khr17]|uniref:hypothetical protein n=1 Tax=Candidatus Chloroploca sp. Khr17 TaxID=2496869 RepID=UPI00101E1A1A|nr:hypothetical protein [Candidatus Chloroploca sp. Khr17]